MNTLLPDYPLIKKVIRLKNRNIQLTMIEEPDWFLEQLSREDSEGRLYLPYWTYLWEASIGLAQYVDTLDRQISKKQILEIGCGFGLAGVVACHAGAEVLFTDAEYEALQFARYNAQQNGVGHRAAFVQMDWNTPSFHAQYIEANVSLTQSCQTGKKFSYILASDVIYEEEHWNPILRLLQDYLSSNGIALFSEPNRNNALGFFEAICDNGFTYKKSTCLVELNGNKTTVCIYTVKRASDLAYAKPILPKKIETSC